jgi:Uma2 family endonuclease
MRHPPEEQPMSTTTEAEPTLTHAEPRRRKPGRQVVISSVDWDAYENLLKVFAEKGDVRLTYDNGDLEIMVPSYEHEGDAVFLARLIGVYTEETKLPLKSGGSTTLRRKKARKGLEPDKCFWIANAARIAGVRDVDLKIHPPPDLAIEVDVTSSSLDRFGIFASLGVPELWRLESDVLRFHKLGDRRKYYEIPTSHSFSGLTPGDLMRFVLQARASADENLVLHEFRQWVRQKIADAAAKMPE